MSVRRARSWALPVATVRRPATYPRRVVAHVLDNAPWAALTGPHAHWAEGDGLVRRYPVDVSPFAAAPDWRDPAAWAALAELVGPGGDVVVSGGTVDPPADWEVRFRGQGVQLVETAALASAADPELVELGDADADDMVAAVERNQPGPFRPRTHLLGRYVGLRRDGRLVAMAGERMHPEGWVEISAVSTDADHRRQGLASRLVLDLVHHIRARGERAMLHASADNVGAIAAYRRLGFAVRRETWFASLVVPDATGPATR